MSFSHTVGGKSHTHTKQRNRGQNHERRASNRTKDSPLSSTKSSGTVQRRGERNSTGEQPGSNEGDYARSNPQRTTAGTITKPHSQQTSNIVTLSDIENKQSKPETGVTVNSKPHLIKNKAIASPPQAQAQAPGPQPRPTPGRKLGLGGNINSDLHTATTEGRGRNKTVSQNKSVRSENSDHVYSRTSASKSKLNQPTNVNRTSNKPIDSVLLNNRTSQSQQSSSRGRGSRAARGTGSTRGGMAYDGRYTSSSLYSANPRPVGQRRPEDEDSSQQRQGEAGPSQGSSQPQQQSESPSSYRVIQPSASKRQQLLNKSTQELKALEDYRASKKPITIHGEARSTGGSISEEEARRALEREHRNKKYDQILKREQQRREWREQEEKEYEEKKARARRVAEENERRRKERADNFLKDEHAKTNEDFLRRLEAGMRPPQSNTSSFPDSPELQQLREMFPQKKLSKLQELLDMTNNDVGKVIDLLMD